MFYEKGDRVVLTVPVGDYPAGTRAQVIRVDTGWISANRYTILLDETGQVIGELLGEDLYCPDRDSSPSSS